jgi:hypothetical protein
VALFENIRRALIPAEQVFALVSPDKPLQRLHPRKEADEIILATEREDGIDQVVADTGFALLDFQAVGDKRKIDGALSDSSA